MNDPEFIRPSPQNHPSGDEPAVIAPNEREIALLTRDKYRVSEEPAGWRVYSKQDESFT